MVHGDSVSATLAKSVEPALINGDLTSVQSALDGTLAAPDVGWVYVTAPDGRVLAHTFIPKFPDALARQSKTVRDRTVLHLEGTPDALVVFEKPVLTGIVGQVYVGFSQARLISSIRRMEIVILLNLTIVIIVAVVGISLVVRRVVAPIRVLTRAAENLGHDGGSAFEELRVRSDDELGVLIRTFNTMAKEIRGQQEKLVARAQERTQELTKANTVLADEIAERERAQQAQRESEKRIRLQSAALEAAANAIVITDAKGNIEWVNPAFSRLRGHTSEEVVGCNPRILKSEQQDSSYYRDLWQTILSGKIWSGEITNRKKSGELYTEEAMM